MSAKRQPAGIPTGGEFAANEHDEASLSLAPGEVKLENGWTSLSGDSKDGADFVVRNPEGTAEYTVFRDHNHDVRVHLTDLETGLTASFRSFAPLGGVDDLADGVPARIHQAPRVDERTRTVEPTASFEKFPNDSQFIDKLAQESLLADETVRAEKPISARHVRVGDVIDFVPILQDRETFPEEPDAVTLMEAESECFAVTEIEQDPTGITLHTTGTSWKLPRQYPVSVMSVIDDYKDHPDYTFPEERA